MAKKPTNRNDGTLGGVDFRTGSDAATDSGNAEFDAGLDTGNSDDNSGAGNGSIAGTDEPTIAGFRTADPGTFGTSGDESAPYGRKADGTPRRAPGRKPGTGTGSGPRAPSSNRAPKASHSQSVDGLQKLLFSLHQMGAVALKTPEMAIDRAEAQILAQAIGDVQAHYNFDVSPEVTIWSNVAIALATVYGPRVMVIASRKRKERRPESSRPVATVSAIRPGDNPAFSFNIPTE